MPSAKFDTGCRADRAAPPVAAHEILRSQQSAVGQLYLDAVVVLFETRHLESAIDLHAKLIDPGGQNPLDIFLPQSQRVVVTGRKVADVQGNPRERRSLSHLSRRQEPIGDA